MILALDLATCTGWAAGVGDVLPAIGHVRLPPPVDQDRGPTFGHFGLWLRAKVTEFEPTTVAFEKPILPKPFLKGRKLIYPTNIETTLLLQGLAAVTELVCWEAGVRCRSTDVSTVKKELAGFGRAEKPDMMAAARKVGLTIAVSDEADAFGVWLVAVRYWAKAFSPDWDRRLWSSRGALL